MQSYPPEHVPGMLSRRRLRIFETIGTYGQTWRGWGPRRSILREDDRRLSIDEATEPIRHRPAGWARCKAGDRSVR
jgi:hypothetical protein